MTPGAPLAYIDPSSGLPLVGWFGAVVAALVAGSGSGLFFLRRTVGAALRRPAVRIGLGVALAGAAGLAAGHFFFGGGGVGQGGTAKVIVIGLDGLDPETTERLMDAGRLPALARLRKEGVYGRLETTNPAQSPVAWATFATGSNPGKHGLFDFILRDRKALVPDLAISAFRLGGSSPTSPRKGVPFWSITSAARVPTTVVRCPVTFPPEEVCGCMLSGMGVPDVRGTQGTFTVFTTRAPGPLTGGVAVAVTITGDRVRTELPGPLDRGLTGRMREITVPLELELAPARDRLTVVCQDQRLVLVPGQWSDFARLTFKVGLLKRVKAIGRFYLRSITPELELYCSPLDFDPKDPAFAISSPPGYAGALADEIGLYRTRGMPDDTGGLNEGVLDEAAFLEEANRILGEREKMLDLELGRFSSGLLVCVFDTPDRIQHMLWRAVDDRHPLHDPAVTARFGRTIEECYERLDRAVGRVLERAPRDAAVIVLSDHGFTTFRRAVHVNAWLREAGYLALRDGAAEGEDLLRAIDWSRTRAYAVGFNSIYLNLAGRESKGIVKPAEAGALAAGIARGLEALVDPQGGARAVKRVYRGEDVYHGPFAAEGPDLVVGYERGYRGSWQTALGAVPAVVFEDNRKRWSGDHLVDPSLVPGVLFANRPLRLERPALADVAPTILALLGLAAPADMDGRSLAPAGAP